VKFKRNTGITNLSGGTAAKPESTDLRYDICRPTASIDWSYASRFRYNSRLVHQFVNKVPSSLPLQPHLLFPSPSSFPDGCVCIIAAPVAVSPAYICRPAGGPFAFRSLVGVA